MGFVTLVSAQFPIGSWKLLLSNTGISSMHTAVTRFDTCIMLDRTNIGPSKRLLENGRCRVQPKERYYNTDPFTDCWAHSVMFRPDKNSVRSLYIFTDTWCSSGQFFNDGTLWQTGGDFEGSNIIRFLTPCPASGTCDWVETNTTLTLGRWYSSNHILPEGNRQIIVGGRSQNNYEFQPKRTPTEKSFNLPWLSLQGNDKLYPFVFLLPNGNLFIFANMNSIQLNYNTNTITKQYPTIPDNPRNYPSGGSGVMLPLKHQDGFTKAEILICGGAEFNVSIFNTITAKASKSCGRIDPLADAPVWAMEDMPIERVMGDMILMPDSTVLIINGAQDGFQGWGKSTVAVLFPVSYNPNAPVGKRFKSFINGTIPRMYHSTANLLPDGRVLCAGSNSHQFYTFSGEFPTEVRTDAFSPPYMGSNFNGIRPQIIGWPEAITYNQVFTLTFTTRYYTLSGAVEVVQHSAPFVTHSFAQGQRQLKLFSVPPAPASNATGNITVPTWTVDVTAAPSPIVAPPAYYLFFVLHRNIPCGKGRWIQQTN
jgi:hypothetical protein